MALPIGWQQTISSPVHRGLHDRVTRPAGDRSSPGNRYRQRIPGGGAQSARQGCLLHRNRGAARESARNKRSSGWVTRMSTSRLATAIKAGRNTPPSTRSSSPAPPKNVPQPLVDQLAESGVMVVPVGERYQQILYRLVKRDGKLVREALRTTLFVPMTGTPKQLRQRQPDPRQARSRQWFLRGGSRVQRAARPVGTTNGRSNASG